MSQTLRVTLSNDEPPSSSTLQEMVQGIEDDTDLDVVDSGTRKNAESRPLVRFKFQQSVVSEDDIRAARRAIDRHTSGLLSGGVSTWSLEGN